MDAYDAHQPFGYTHFDALFQVEDAKAVEQEILAYCKDKHFQMAKREWMRLQKRERGYLIEYITNRAIRRII